VWGATIITTLEPCAHHGKTPPCTDAIIAAGIKKVVSATVDSNPIVNGRGHARLMRAGIEVVDGVLADFAGQYYAPYFKFITTRMPFVTIKFAQSIDGRLATKSGDSKWISSQESLKYSHYLRKINDAILVGANTVRNDDPRLTTRLVKGKNPVRIILSPAGRPNPKAKVFSDRAAQTFVATSSGRKSNAGFNLIPVPKTRSGLDLRQLLKKLGKMDITSLLVEGGAETITSFLSQKLVDRIEVCMAPILIGEGINSVGELRIEKVKQALKLKKVSYSKFGRDIIIKGTPVWN
jgi:diaminohydroxyphosphoribosylaminopyrimidine deaminase/5-amino-6-(5-phosphoribosylamino)uracil reductase